MSRRIRQDPYSRMRRRREWREARTPSGDRRKRENGEKQVGGERQEDDMREREGMLMGEKEVGGGGRWRGGRELREEGGGAK